MSSTRTQKNQEASQAEFMKQMEVFRSHVAELQAMADNHIGADPESTLWGAAGTLQHWNAILARVTDALLRDGMIVETAGDYRLGDGAALNLDAETGLMRPAAPDRLPLGRSFSWASWWAQRDRRWLRRSACVGAGERGRRSM